LIAENYTTFSNGSGDKKKVLILMIEMLQ